MATSSISKEEAKLEVFLQWLQANGAELRGCTIKPCSPNKGFGIFSSDPIPEDGVVMVVPLDLAITPMRVLQDPLLGPRCRAMFEEGDVDDRFLIILFIALESIRPGSTWKPYLDMLPRTFGNPLWFQEDELAELRGTTLYRATLLQKEKLQALYSEKVKDLLEDLLRNDVNSSVAEVQFEVFLWANSIFWARALNIPLPHAYVFPNSLSGQENHATEQTADGQTLDASAKTGEDNYDQQYSKLEHPQKVWVEGLVPGIDFCNHDARASATWEVDSMGSVTGIPNSMYLILADRRTAEVGKEILISYGNKGNEELLYLYGFSLENNKDDFLMIHYPMEAFQSVPSAERKARLLEMQKADLRCLLPKSLLDHGFFSESTILDEDNTKKNNSEACSYSWSGQRKVPSYIHKLVFPQNFLTALRTIAMQENEVAQVYTLLGELVGSDEERQPSENEVQAAVWEACGDYGALELLVDLLRVKKMQLEDGSGEEPYDNELLSGCHAMTLDSLESELETSKASQMNRNKWSSIVYRRGQKQLASLFLREAEHALELCANDQG